jgi:hypothetical protein
VGKNGRKWAKCCKQEVGSKRQETGSCWERKQVLNAGNRKQEVGILESLKGQCHQIFHLWFFSSNNFSWPQ